MDGDQPVVTPDVPPIVGRPAVHAGAVIGSVLDTYAAIFRASPCLQA